MITFLKSKKNKPLQNIINKLNDLFLFDYNYNTDETILYIYPYSFNNQLESELLKHINDYDNLEKTSDLRENTFDNIIYTTNNIKQWSQMIGMIKGITTALGYRVNVSNLYECENENHIKIEFLD